MVPARIDASRWRVTVCFVSFVDGLGLETALVYSWSSPERLQERIVAFSAVYF